jgi:hypothetical protein
MLAGVSQIPSPARRRFSMHSPYFLPPSILLHSLARKNTPQSSEPFTHLSQSTHIPFRFLCTRRCQGQNFNVVFGQVWSTQVVTNSHGGTIVRRHRRRYTLAIAAGTRHTTIESWAPSCKSRCTMTYIRLWAPVDLVSLLMHVVVGNLYVRLSSVPMSREMPLIVSPYLMHNIHPTLSFVRSCVKAIVQIYQRLTTRPSGVW